MAFSLATRPTVTDTERQRKRALVRAAVLLLLPAALSLASRSLFGTRRGVLVSFAGAVIGVACAWAARYRRDRVFPWRSLLAAGVVGAVAAQSLHGAVNAMPVMKMLKTIWIPIGRGLCYAWGLGLLLQMMRDARREQARARYERKLLKTPIPPDAARPGRPPGGG
jgi:hypothetical protein